MLSRKQNCCCGANPCRICVHAENCSATPISGATVTISHSGTVVSTCNTNSSGNCCIDVTSIGAGSYHVDVAKSGSTTYSTNATISCPGDTNVTAVLAVPGSGGVNFFVSLCDNVDLTVAHASIAINGGNYPTASNGQVYLSLAPGTYSWTATADRVDSVSGSITVSDSCSLLARSASLVPSSGYACPNTSCNPGTGIIGNLPIAITLHGTDSVYGAFTMTHSSFPNGWFGTLTGKNIAAQCGCGAANNVTIQYSFVSGPECQAGSKFTINSAGGRCPGDVAGGFGYQFSDFGSSASGTAPPGLNIVTTIPPCNAGTQVDVLYPSGGTITITE